MATGVAFATLTGNQDIDALLFGSKWNVNNLTFAFPTSAAYFGSAAVYDNAETNDNVVYAGRFLALNTAMQTAFLFTKDQYQSVSGLRFTKVTPTTNNADIALARTSDDSLPTANGRFPTTTHEGDIWFNDHDYNAPVRGNFAWATFLHETGHTMGLKHGHVGDHGPAMTAMTTAHDSPEFSVMTYRSFAGGPASAYTIEQFGFPQTLMMYDIAAIQQMYGANFTSNAGNSVYTFSQSTGQEFINGVSQGTPGANRIFQTIWDGGGVDTYNLSNYTTALNISLAAGGWSLFSTAQRANLGSGHFARANVFNALQYHGDLRSLIENAIGGSGSDRISGNQVHNVLTGNNGNDTLIGHGGGDSVVGGVGNDILYGDFLLTGGSAGTGYASLPFGTANNGFSTARNISSNFAVSADADIANSTIWAHTTVNAVGNGHGGYYTLSLVAGTTIVIDIDHTTGGYDSWVQFGNTSTLLAQSDDSRLDPGSPVKPGDPSNTQDSGLSFVIPTTGQYFIAVGSFQGVGNNGSYSDFIPIGAGYELNVSIIAPGGALGTPTSDVLNGGPGADTMFGGAGNDTYYVDNAGDIVNEAVAGSGGIDIIQSSISLSLANASRVLGAVENLLLTGTAVSGVGNALNNSIIGNALANGLAGGAGNDGLRGGAGNDTLSGGAGNDLFIFNTPLNAANNVDRILDFNVANDTIGLENAIFKALGAAGTLLNAMFWKSTAGVAHDTNDRIIYDIDSGNLFYDANGSLAGGAVRFAVLAPNLALTNADFLVM